MTFVNLPSLSEKSFWRYFNFTSLYFAEGIPMGMLFIGLPAWMAMNGNTPTEIGAFAFSCSVPWTFKFIVAPLMDRYTFLAMGRKRPWVIFAQTGLVASMITMAFVPDPLNNLGLFNAAAFLVSAFGAMQDAATDGMAIDVVPDDQQARVNGFMAGARMIGSSMALALGSWLLNVYSFKVSILVLGILIGLVLLVPLFLREQPGEKLLPWTSGKASHESDNMQVKSWPTIFRSLFSVFRLKNSLLVCLLLFVTQGAYNYFETLLPLFTVQISGWTNVQYSQVFATADLVSGIGGMLIGGYLIERFQKKRMINIYFLVIILSVGTLIFLKQQWTNSSFVNGFILVYRWFNAFAKIGVFAIAMQCCSKKVSASQFTFYMTIGAVGSMVGATLIGPAKENLSWEMTFLLFTIFIGAAFIILQLLNLDEHMENLTEIKNDEARRQTKILSPQFEHFPESR